MHRERFGGSGGYKRPSNDERTECGKRIFPERDGVDAATFKVADQATPVSPSLTVHEQPAKGPRSPNHPDLQHNAFVSQGINTIQTSSVEGSDGIMSLSTQQQNRRYRADTGRRNGPNFSKGSVWQRTGTGLKLK